MASERGTERSLSGAFAAGVLTWAIPGAGYILTGRALRGLVIAAVVVSVFALGLALGGHLFGLRHVQDMGLLAYVYGFCDVGAGLGYFVCLWQNVGVADQAQRATSEYGNYFLMIAGLLNFLAALDTYDIAVGRKG